MRRLLPILLLLSAGCAHRILVLSDPPGARVEIAGQTVGTTPFETVLEGHPFQRSRARVSVPGYRSVTLDLTRDRRPFKRVFEFLTFRWRRALGLRPCVTHEVILVRRHGGSGTWSAGEVE